MEGAGVGGEFPGGPAGGGRGDVVAERRAVGVSAGLEGPDEEEGAWWQSPVVLAVIVLVLTLALYLIFW
jgi:SSS family solute:Na+ symporter